MSTIFALATPPGRSGVAVMRLSGPRAFPMAQQIGAESALAHPRRAVLCDLIHPASRQIVDRALVLCFPGPASFTGEDVVELHCHGAPTILDLLAQVLEGLGAIPAAPGAFTRRALENGKLDLIGAEALDGILHARDEAQLRLAQGQGGQQRQDLFTQMRTDLTHLMAASEALVDFPDDDLPETLVRESQTRLDDLRAQVADLAQRSDLAQVLDAGLEIMLIGPPNAGKSTLMNALAGYERAIVTPQPGTTRDFVELELKIGPHQVHFVDTAGLREDSDDPIERLGIERTLQRLRSATLILNLSEDGVWQTVQAEAPLWQVRTKSPPPGLPDNEAALHLAAGDPCQPGVEELLEKIDLFLKNRFGAVFEGVAFYRQRQMFHVKQMLESLTEAQQHDDLPELQGESLRRAAQSLGHLSGQIHVEDVLDTLFAGFCIGK